MAFLIVIKASSFVPLYHLLFPQLLVLPLQQGAFGYKFCEEHEYTTVNFPFSI